MARPERVTALVLLSPGGIVPDQWSFVARALPLLMLGRWGKRRITRLVLGGEAIPAADEDAMLVYLTHFKPRVGVLPIFLDTELRQLGMPVRLVMGGRDVLRDAKKVSGRMKQLVPQLTTIILPEAGHAVVNARPAVFAFLVSARRLSR